jgi:hypothetical protein
VELVERAEQVRVVPARVELRRVVVVVVVRRRSAWVELVTPAELDSHSTFSVRALPSSADLGRKICELLGSSPTPL